METIIEEEIEKEKSGVREWIREDDDEMDNMVDLYYKLQKDSSGQGNLRGEWCHDLAKWLSQYLYFFYFLLFSDYYFSFYFLFFIFLLMDTQEESDS